MATRKTSTPPPTDAALSVTITQQALNVVRQLLNAQGWAKGIGDIYVGGQLLAETLPLTDISWVKTEKELLVMDDAARATYLAADKAWCDKPITLSVTEAERDAIERAFQHNVEALVKAGKLGANATLYELVKAFQIKAVPVAQTESKG